MPEPLFKIGDWAVVTSKECAAIYMLTGKINKVTTQETSSTFYQLLINLPSGEREFGVFENEINHA